MRAVAGRYRLQPADASDFVQESLLRVCRNAVRFRGEASVSTWLTRIVMNTSSDFLRGRFGDLPELDKTASLDSVAPFLSASSDDWALSMTVRQGLAVLPKLQSQALVAIDVWGFQTAEIAKATGAAIGTIKSRRARARATMREYFKAEGQHSYEAVAA